MNKLIKIILISAVIFSSTAEATVQKVIDNSFKIYTYGKSNKTGSGFVSDKLKGYIITNAHVVKGGEAFQVSGLDGVKYYAKSIYVSKVSDLAILKVETNKLKLDGIKHCKTSSLKIGTNLYNFGNPEGYDFILTRGYISGMKRPLVGFHGINHDFIVQNLINSAGQSGSAVIKTSDNCIVGVFTAYKPDSYIGFSTPIEEVEKIIIDFNKFVPDVK